MCVHGIHTHAYKYAMKVKRKERSQRLGKEQVRNLFKRWGMSLRLIGNQGTLDWIEGLCFEMGLLIKSRPQTVVSRRVLWLRTELPFYGLKRS